MVERPILFSGPMVRAILAGTKTQTRRVVKLPEGARDVLWWNGYEGKPQPGYADPGVRVVVQTGLRILPCPFGFVGDTLWVRETWALSGNEDGHTIDVWGSLCEARDAVRFYRADTEAAPYGLRRLPRGDVFDGHWCPSIHMPRWASRLTLEVVSVRVERVQQITNEDARAEGARELPLQEGEPGAWWTMDASRGADAYARAPAAAFGRLWDTINGKRAPWASNPWVWVVEFRRASEPRP
jgi:hypothetical protein